MKEKRFKKYELLTGIRMKEGYKDPRWFEKRDEILCRDGHKCSVCSSIYNLQVHHIYYDSNLPVWDYPNKSLITLCLKCHKDVHKIKNVIYDYDGESVDILQDMYWFNNLTEEEREAFNNGEMIEIEVQPLFQSKKAKTT